MQSHVTHLLERAVRESASSQEQVEKESLSAVTRHTPVIGESRERERVITGTGGEGELECSHTSHTWLSRHDTIF